MTGGRWVFSCNDCCVTAGPTLRLNAEAAQLRHRRETGHRHGQIDPEYMLSKAWWEGRRAMNTFPTAAEHRRRNGS